MQSDLIFESKVAALIYKSKTDWGTSHVCQPFADGITEGTPINQDDTLG